MSCLPRYSLFTQRTAGRSLESINGLNCSQPEGQQQLREHAFQRVNLSPTKHFVSTYKKQTKICQQGWIDIQSG